MFNKLPNTNENNLRCQIDRLFEKLDTMDPTSEEYKAVRKQAEALYKLRETDSNVNSKKRENHTAWAAIAANIFGIAMIVEYEKTAVVTTKAITMLKKLL